MTEKKWMWLLVVACMFQKPYLAVSILLMLVWVWHRYAGVS